MSVASDPALPRALLIHAAGASFGSAGTVLTAEGIELRVATGPLEELVGEPTVPTVVLVEADLARRPGLDRVLRELPPGIVAIAVDERVEALPGVWESALLTLPPAADGDRLLRTLRTAFQHAAIALAAARADRDALRRRDALAELGRIGGELLAINDPRAIAAATLRHARRLVPCQIGRFHLLTDDAEGERHLRLLGADPVAASPAGGGPPAAAVRAVASGEVVIDPPAADAGGPHGGAGHTAASLAAPVGAPGEPPLGALELVRRNGAFDAIDAELARSLGALAAAALRAAWRSQATERLFESFVKVTATAIDLRDRTTAGHSIRVATLTCELATIVDRATRGPYAGTRFTPRQMRELRYAALLHDFGKIGVREELLVKAKKLPPHLIERVEARFDLIRRTFEADHHRRRAEHLLHHGRDGFDAVDRGFESELRACTEQVDRFRAAVHAANEPSILPEEGAADLDQIAHQTFRGPNDEPEPYITGEELHFLRIPKGSLDEGERREIESHVEQTYRYLRQIPWTDDLDRVPEIAHAHHEKLDGRGYPRGIGANDIPVQSRLMTVADIFDALTAADRPYKRALSADRALDILVGEARVGMLDAALVDLLIESRAYRSILDRDWREL